MALALSHPVTWTVDCRTARTRSETRTWHEVTIEVDGSVTTVHDLAAERTAAALGGVCTCLDVADRAVPAFQAWARAVTRDLPDPLMTLDAGRSWLPATLAHCCYRNGFDTPQEAAEHGRDPRHHAWVHLADIAHVRAIVEAAGILEPPAPSGEFERQLWECGLRPEEVAGVAAAVPCREPLTVAFHLVVADRKPDLTWLAGAVADVDADLRMATWLAWAGGRDDRYPRLDIGPLTFGTHATQGLIQLRYWPDDIDALAKAFDVPFRTAKVALASWAQAGHRPDVADLVAAGRPCLAVPPLAPTRDEVGRLRLALRGATDQSDTALALALVRHGTLARTVSAQAGTSPARSEPPSR